MDNLKQLITFNSTRHRLWTENEKFASEVPHKALVLDAGSGSAPYKQLFEHATYESADFEQVNKEYANSTYTCNLDNIPVEDCRFDYIIFNQVMEHLPNPKKVLLELNRVLKPDGKMIYTGPLFYEEHEQPYDYYRYTQFGLHELFSSTNFTIDRLDWLEGYYGTVGYQLNRMAKYLPLNPKYLGAGIKGYLLAPAMLLLKVIFSGCSILFHRLELKEKYTLKGYPKNYVAIVRKPL